MTKAEFKALSREDAFWACFECRPIVSSNIDLLNKKDLNDQLSKPEKQSAELGNKIESLENSIENLIDQINQNETKMTILYSDALKLSSGPQAELGDKVSKTETVINPVNVGQLVKQALDEQKKADLDKENRGLNFIIHRIPESNKADPKSRKQDDLQVIEQLFGELEIEVEPKECFRLGRFNKEADPESRKPRPLKVKMNSQEDQTQVMMNLSKLKDAPEFLKRLSISPDLSKEERAELNDKLREAKQLTSESPNLIYKVKGSPGNYHFIKINKTRNEQNSNPEPENNPKNRSASGSTGEKTEA